MVIPEKFFLRPGVMKQHKIQTQCKPSRVFIPIEHCLSIHTKLTSTCPSGKLCFTKALFAFLCWLVKNSPPPSPPPTPPTGSNCIITKPCNFQWEFSEYIWLLKLMLTPALHAKLLHVDTKLSVSHYIHPQMKC